MIAMGLEIRAVGVAVEHLRGLASAGTIHALIKLNDPGTFADEVEEALELKHADRPSPRNGLLRDSMISHASADRSASKLSSLICSKWWGLRPRPGELDLGYP